MVNGELNSCFSIRLQLLVNLIIYSHLLNAGDFILLYFPMFFVMYLYC